MRQSFVEVVPYNTNWPYLFEREAAIVRQLLGDNCIDIHHIGSTSVVGLCAKPVIDMIPVVKNILQVDQCSTVMEAEGFQVRGEYGMPFRRFFIKEAPHDACNVHVYEKGNLEIERHVRFRDYMRTHDQARQAYAALKTELAQKHSQDRMAYCLGKTAFVQEIDAKAGFTGTRIVQALTDQEWEAYHRIKKDQLFDPYSVPYNLNHSTLVAHNHFHFVFIKGTEIVSIAEVAWIGADQAAIIALATSQEHKGKGYNQQLMALLEKWVRHQGRNIIPTPALTNNP
jgi:GrpB-like predicted nucleotidyltransferase (UPF0157 family)/predicted GNAT family acetyltransferase